MHFDSLTYDRGDLSKVERRDYIDAVLCLSRKPPQTMVTEFPGVRNRYDDFVAVHINQTMHIHGTVRVLFPL
jgi:tyrosinase